MLSYGFYIPVEQQGYLLSVQPHGFRFHSHFYLNGTVRLVQYDFSFVHVLLFTALLFVVCLGLEEFGVVAYEIGTPNNLFLRRDEVIGRKGMIDK